MKRVLLRVLLGLLAVLGLYAVVIVGIVMAGFIRGFAATYGKSPAVTIHYIDCSEAHPPPECGKLAQTGLAPSAH